MQYIQPGRLYICLCGRSSVVVSICRLNWNNLSDTHSCFWYFLLRTICIYILLMWKTAVPTCFIVVTTYQHKWLSFLQLLSWKFNDFSCLLYLFLLRYTILNLTKYIQKKCQYLQYQISIIRFLMKYIFIVCLFGVINTDTLL